MTTDLKSIVIRIDAPNGKTIGTGFVLSDGLIATCVSGEKLELLRFRAER